MAQGAVEGAEEGAGVWRPLRKGQDEENNFPSIVSEVKRTEPKLQHCGDAAGVVLEAGAGAGAREETARRESEGGHGQVIHSSPLKQEAELSPAGRRSPFHDEVGELLSEVDDEEEHNWDTIPNEPASPALRGVHRIAVEVMRRSFGSADGDPGMYRRLGHEQQRVLSTNSFFECR